MLDNPPSGALKKNMSNGKNVMYDPNKNVILFSEKNGQIQLMYKPDTKINGYPTNLDFYNSL